MTEETYNNIVQIHGEVTACKSRISHLDGILADHKKHPQAVYQTIQVDGKYIQLTKEEFDDFFTYLREHFVADLKAAEDKFDTL